MEYSKEQLRRIYDGLPEDVKEAMFSTDSSKVIMEIGNKYKMHIDQISELGKQTGYIMLGVLDPMDFTSILKSKLGLDTQTAGNIVIEINEKIFLKIKESLRQIHSGKTTGVDQKSTSSASSNIIKNVETSVLNVPKKTIDILKGDVVPPEKKTDTGILGFQADKPKQLNQLGSVNILEERMKAGFVAPEEKTEKEDQKTIGKPMDPYRELA